MALILKDRVLETSQTGGTGIIALAGPVNAYQSFSSAIGNGNTTYYTIEDNADGQWEVGIGTVGAGTLTRNTVLSSSNGGSLVNFGTSIKNVFCDYPASKAASLDSNEKSIFGGNNYQNYASIAAPSYVEGRVWYDSTEKALAFYNDSSALAVHVGQDLIVKVINNTGSTIANGSPVYITSTSSGQTYPNVALAKADVAATSSIIGLTNGAIANGAIGYVTSQGIIDNVNTGTFTVGQPLYLSPYSAGQIMNTIPPTGITVQVGVVSYVDTSVGKIYVKQTAALSVPASIITGTVAVANGGTGQSSPLVAGSVVYGASTTAMGVTAAGTTGAVLTSNGASAPTWSTTAGVTQSDVGSAPNQIPLNQYLGSMAYEDKAGVNITGGTATLARVTVNGSTVPTNGMYLPAANSVGISTNTTERLRIDSSGNLGLGTSSPNGYGAGYTVFTTNATTGSVLDLNVNGTRTGSVFATVAETRLSSITSVPLLFYTANTERMRIHATGGVSIGNTTDRGAGNLNVSGVVITNGYTVATLPAGVVGMRAYVTNSLTPTYGSAVVGGGAVTIPVFYNGTTWIVA